MSSPSANYRDLLRFGLPAMLAVVTEPVAGLLDTAFVGNFNARALAGLGLTASVFSSFAWVFNFLIHGVTARVAHGLGRRDEAAIRLQVTLSLWVAMTLGIAATLALFLLERSILAYWMGAKPELLEVAVPYYRVRAAGFAFVLCLSVITGTLRGLQKIFLSLILLAMATILNAVFTYVAIFHWGWGLEGAAWGTTLSFLFAAAAGWVLIGRLIGFQNFRTLPWKEVLGFGQEASQLFGRTASLTLAFSLTTAVASRLSQTALAAHQIALQFWLLASFLIDGFAVTASALGGQALGAGDRETFVQIARRLIVLGVLTGMGFAIFYGFAGGWIVSRMTPSAAVQNEVGTVWKIVIWTQPLNAAVYVLDGILFGSRDFSFLRRRMMEGVFLGAVPVLAVAYLEGSLLWVWSALVVLNAYRLVTSSWFLERGRPGTATF